MHRGHGVTSNFEVWSRGHSRISVDTNCVPGLSRKYSAYGSDHPLLMHMAIHIHVLKILVHFLKEHENTKPVEAETYLKGQSGPTPFVSFSATRL